MKTKGDETMFEHISKLALALALSVATLGVAHAQAPGQAYKSPEDCIADYSKLDTNRDGFVDNNEMSKYSIVRTKIDTNQDGMLSADERTVFCKSGLAKAFRPAG
jgi:hypothetical protein